MSEQVFKTSGIDSGAGWRFGCDFPLLLSFGDFLDFEAWRSYPGYALGIRGGVTTARRGRQWCAYATRGSALIGGSWDSGNGLRSMRQVRDVAFDDARYNFAAGEDYVWCLLCFPDE